jgi:hypothetical protein
MSTWIPLFALANIEVRRPIEVDGFALASIHDVHFAVRRLERRYGKEIVRAAYERLSGAGLLQNYAAGTGTAS